jgi:alkylhydroperoxidase family enzyme
MDLPILTSDAAPAAAQPILDGIAADVGMIPNFAATIAASPTLLGAFDGLRRAVGDPSFDPVRREVVGVAVGVAVDNRYGVAFHSTMLGMLGLDADDIERLRAGGEPADPVLAATAAFARAVALDRGAVDPSVVDRAEAAGLSAEDLLQIVAECTLAGLVGVVDNLVGRVDLDDLFAPQAWKAG